MGTRQDYSKSQLRKLFLGIRDWPPEKLSKKHCLGWDERMADDTTRWRHGELQWARAAVRMFGEYPQDWYGALRCMYVEWGGMTKSEARRHTERIRTAARSSGQIKFSREYIEAEFRKIMNLPAAELTLAKCVACFVLDGGERVRMRGKIEWAYSAGSIFAGDPKNWYKALEEMYVQVGGYTRRKARKRVEEIRKAGDESSGEHWRKFSDSELEAKFKEIMDWPDEMLTPSYCKENLDHYAAICRRYGGGPEKWYTALEKLFASAGGLSKKEAKERVDSIRDAAKREGASATVARLGKERESIVRGLALEFELKNIPASRMGESETAFLELAKCATPEEHEALAFSMQRVLVESACDLQIGIPREVHIPSREPPGKADKALVRKTKVGNAGALYGAVLGEAVQMTRGSLWWQETTRACLLARAARIHYSKLVAAGECAQARTAARLHR